MKIKIGYGIDTKKSNQVLRIGRLLIVGLPGIFTTMAGRRIRQSVLSRSPPGTEVILAGLANAFSGYVTTSSEYQVGSRSNSLSVI